MVRSKTFLTIAILFFGLIFTSSSVICKEWLQDQVFYELLYHETKQLGDYAFNGIKVTNIGWFGSVENIQITFKVDSPNHSKDRPKHEIYTEYLNKPPSVKIYKGNDFYLNFDNKEYKPDVAIVTNEHGVEIKEPKPDGNKKGYTIDATCKELCARSSVSLATVWFDKGINKKLNPEVKANNQPCKPFRDRSFANKYHLIPLSLFSIGVLFCGIAIGLWLQRKENSIEDTPIENKKEISFTDGLKAVADMKEFMELYSKNK